MNEFVWELIEIYKGGGIVKGWVHCGREKFGNFQIVCTA